MVCYMTIALLSPALALQTAAGLPLWVSLIAVGLVGTFYTTIGGIKSVVWTDAFQTLIILSGVMAALIKGSMDVGGFGQVWSGTVQKGRLILDNVDMDPRTRHTVFGCLMGTTTAWLGSFFGQSFVQRLCSTRSQKDAQRVVLFVGPLNLIYGTMLIVTGMALLVYFDFIGCDPLAAGYVANANQLMPYFVIRTLGFIPGLSGLYISTIFSGALSTLSSGINSLAANTVEDFLHPVLRNLRESTATAVSKVLVFVYGIVTICLAYMIKEVKGPVTQLTFVAMGASGGPVFGLFLLGAIFPQANKVGASIGCLVGLAFCLWLNVAKMMYGAVTPTLPPGPTDTCQDSSIADAGGNETLTTSLIGMIQSHDSLGGGAPSTVMTTTTSDLQTIYDSGFHLYDLSYIWTPLLGALTSLFAGLIISKIYELSTGIKERPKPEYLFPFMRRFWYKKDKKTKEEQELEVCFITEQKI